MLSSSKLVIDHAAAPRRPRKPADSFKSLAGFQPLPLHFSLQSNTSGVLPVVLSSAKGCS